MTKSLLIIFAKNPVLGKVKSRLSATMGDEKALEIYCKLLLYTHKVTLQLNCEKAIFYSDYIDNDDNWDNTLYQKHIQKGNDLGLKMLNAFRKGFELGYEKISIIGTDNFEITPEIINNGFELLKSNDIVIGPAKDGGYYFLGMKKLYPSIFKNKQWSTSSVFNNTLTDIENEGLTFKTLPALNDIDTEEDWKRSLSN